MRWRPHIGTVLLAVNLVILVLPLGGIAFLRLYDLELVRRTESELMMQGVLIAAAYRDEILKIAKKRAHESGSEGKKLEYGTPLSPKYLAKAIAPPDSVPVLPQLDFSKDAVAPPAPEGKKPSVPPDADAVVAAQRLASLIKACRKATLAGVRVLDFRGTVVASTGTEKGLSLRARPEVQRCLRGESVSLLRERTPVLPVPPIDSISRRSRVRVFVSIPVVHGNRVLGAVVLSRTPLDILKALYFKRYHLAIAALVVLAAATLVSVLTALTITKPVKALTRQARRVSKGETGAALPLEKPGTREVALLSDAFSSMAQSLQERAEYINIFASNVSHEFKTPLTSLRGTTELLRDHFGEMSEQDRSRFLAMLEKDLDRLETLVRRLLDLARAEVIQPGDETADVDQVLDAIVERFRQEGLDVRVDHHARGVRVRMSAENLSSVLFNLLDNARRHGGPEIRAHIVTKAESESDRKLIAITVSDNGPGISESNRPRVFDRFFTTSRDKGGTGLGLSIVHALVTAHDGTIFLESGSPGTTFRVTLPCRDEPDSSPTS